MEPYPNSSINLTKLIGVVFKSYLYLKLGKQAKLLIFFLQLKLQFVEEKIQSQTSEF